jgi:hypothetical protein
MIDTENALRVMLRSWMQCGRVAIAGTEVVFAKEVWEIMKKDENES